VSDIQLAVSEAVTNAVMHAYRRDAQPGDVEVHAAMTSGWFEVRVVDGGSGMKPRNDSPGVGLGLPLIYRLADQVEVRERADGNGMELCMRFPSEIRLPTAESHRRRRRSRPRLSHADTGSAGAWASSHSRAPSRALSRCA
jgi:hypothetical protein